MEFRLTRGIIIFFKSTEHEAMPRLLGKMICDFKFDENVEKFKHLIHPK